MTAEDAEAKPDSTPNDSNTATSTAPPNKEELLELVRAIKFSNPEWSQRQVHKEIVETLVKEVPSLQDVKLNDVKKVWKKAVIAVREGGGGQSEKESSKDESKDESKKESKDESKKEAKPKEEDDKNKSNEASTSDNADLAKLLEGQTPEVFTVGDASQVYPDLAKFYTSSRLAKEVAKVDQEMAQDAKTFVHVYLDVPANKSGQAPHQGLISFQRNTSNNDNKKGAGGDHDEGDDWEIIKIQKAAPLSATDTTKHVMLAYNRDKNLKTFIHPEEGEGDGDGDELNGYDKIANMIDQSGVGGALGGSGGTKAYFYARVTKLKKSPGILSIDYTRLAPTQEW